jgi:hypothetical protein
MHPVDPSSQGGRKRGMLCVPSRQLLGLRTRSPRQTDGNDAGMHAMNRAGVTSIGYAGRCALTSSHALGAFTDCRAQQKRLGTEWRSALIERSEEVLPKKSDAHRSRGGLSSQRHLLRGNQLLVNLISRIHVRVYSFQSCQVHDQTTRLVALRRSRARNPRWEPGMGMIPDPRQIGDGGGDPWTPDPRRIGDRPGMGMVPDCRRVPSSCT